MLVKSTDAIRVAHRVVFVIQTSMNAVFRVCIVMRYFPGVRRTLAGIGFILSGKTDSTHSAFIGQHLVYLPVGKPMQLLVDPVALLIILSDTGDVTNNYGIDPVSRTVPRNSRRPC